jgi:hypothetical protein
MFTATIFIVMVSMSNRVDRSSLRMAGFVPGHFHFGLQDTLRVTPIVRQRVTV